MVPLQEGCHLSSQLSLAIEQKQHETEKGNPDN